MSFQRAHIISTVQGEFAVVSKIAYINRVSTPFDIKFRGDDHDEHQVPSIIHCLCIALNVGKTLGIDFISLCYEYQSHVHRCYEIHKHNVNNLTSQCHI
jgi:hypothetical protein